MRNGFYNGRTPGLTIKPSDPCIARLRDIRGSTGHDGVARIATDAVFEHIDPPRLQRTPEAAKRLRLMVGLGWPPVRASVVTARGRVARVRGYERAPCSPSRPI